jgi:hypothetical protein
MCGTVMTGDRRRWTPIIPQSFVHRSAVSNADSTTWREWPGHAPAGQGRDVVAVSDVPAHRWRRQWRGQRGSWSSGSETTSSDSIVASLDWSSAPAERDRTVAPTATAGLAAAPKVADLEPRCVADGPDREEDCSMPILTRLRGFLEANKVPYSVHKAPPESSRPVVRFPPRGR